MEVRQKKARKKLPFRLLDEVKNTNDLIKNQYDAMYLLLLSAEAMAKRQEEIFNGNKKIGKYPTQVDRDLMLNPMQEWRESQACEILKQLRYLYRNKKSECTDWSNIDKVYQKI
jgi:hypothetical protein